MSAERQTDSAGIGVVYEDRLPLAISVLSSPWEPSQRLRLEQGNVDLLKTLVAMEEGGSESNGEEEKDPDLQRVEFKVNLVLDLVAQLYRDHLALPPLTPIRLSGEGLEWFDTSSHSEGTWLQVQLYISQRFPQPLILSGSSAPAGDDPAYPCRMRLEGLSQPLQDALERFIFRHHRRLIAYQRRAAGRSG